MKKIVHKLSAGVFTLSMFLNFQITTSALENLDSDVYVNKKGVIIENYSLFRQYYSQQLIDQFDQDYYDSFANTDFSNVKVSEKYYKTITTYEADGDISANFIVEFDSLEEVEEDMNNEVQVFANNCGNGCRETTYKRVELDVIEASNVFDVGHVKITTEWLIMPSTRSYDISAIRFLTPVDIDGMVGVQIADNTTCSYELDGANTKYTQYGIGTSMNIVDEVSNTLTMEMDVTLQYVNNNLTDWAYNDIYGTYQHAQYSVTQSQSISYSFSSSGLGGVILFNDSNISSKYDNMGGVIYNSQF